MIKIAKEHRNNTFEELIENFNTVMNILVFSKKVQRTLYKEGYSEHVAKKKPFISKKIAKNYMNGAICKKIVLLNGII